MSTRVSIITSLRDREAGNYDVDGSIAQNVRTCHSSPVNFFIGTFIREIQN